MVKPIVMPLAGLLVALASVSVAVHNAAQVDLEREKAALLALHRADREAHFRKDVDLLQQHGPDEFITVSDGAIRRVGKEEERRFFAEYFRGATYLEWDDLEPPIVRVSRDGSMGWMITRVSVRRTQAQPTGEEPQLAFVYAGIMTYEKVNGAWTRVANVSTFMRRP